MALQERDTGNNHCRTRLTQEKGVSSMARGIDGADIPAREVGKQDFFSSLYVIVVESRQSVFASAPIFVTFVVSVRLANKYNTVKASADYLL